MEPITIQKVIVQSHSHYLLILSNGEEILVHEDLLVRYQLLVGKEFDPGLLDELGYESEIHRAYAKAINFISYRPRSILEVKQYLKRKEIVVDTTVEVITRLLAKGYLDDEVFAQKWVANRQLLKPKSKLALRAELKEKGISTQIIEEILTTIDVEEQREQAEQIALKKMRQWREKEWSEVRPRIFRFLTYKGYETDVILKILPKLEMEFAKLA